MLSREIYLKPIKKLKKKLISKKNTHFSAWAKIICLVNLICRYEKISIKKKLKSHPFYIVKNLIEQTDKMFDALIESEFIEGGNNFNSKKINDKELLHENLFNVIWNKYNSKEFKEYINRYKHRIKINKLNIKGKKIIDFGCGNGMFCFALYEMGAKEVFGIDFGQDSINFAKSFAKKRYKTNKIKFLRKTVYKTGLKKNYFDFAIQNGVFHHLKNEDRAIKEISRVLKDGGKLWYYTAGKNDIANSLLDLARESTVNIPYDFKFKIFSSINMSTNKKIHLMDGFTAVYKRETFKDLTKKLSKHNFKKFSLLQGGFSTDKDPKMIANYDYGVEKYGEGDLRVFCEKFK